MSNTSFDSIMSSDDVNQMNKVMKIRKDLMTYIGTENLINFIKEIIETTDGIDFRSEVARNYIDKNRPNFVLTMTNIQMDPKKSNDMYYVNNLTNEVTNFINDNVISKLSKYLMDSIEGNEELQEAIKSLGEEVRLASFINIFSIKLNAEKNIVNFEYFI